jgi:hypothetical protein
MRLVVVLDLYGTDESRLSTLGVELLQIPDLEHGEPDAVFFLCLVMSDGTERRSIDITYTNSDEDTLSDDHVHDPARGVRSPWLLCFKVLAEEVDRAMNVGQQETRGWWS